MTPLIDVSLVLVVILMVATPLTLQSGIAVNGAARSGRSAAHVRKIERIELSVRDDGTVDVNHRVVQRDSLAAALAPLLADSPTGSVVVQCGDHVAHGTFVSVLDEARQLGARNIAVVGD
jgi:biopolymer transport protein ExbD